MAAEATHVVPLPETAVRSRGPATSAVPPLPETAAVHWRPPMDARRLRRRGRLWTLTTAAHVVPFLAAGILLVVIQPLAVAVSVASFGHAWIIPMLYAARGANVLRPRARTGAAAERTALGLLGDLIGHEQRALHAATGLVVERGRLGVWAVGEAGAVLLTARGRRASCFCVRVADPDLPSADRIAHLLLALRADEVGFAPSPTWPSRARGGACAAGCPRRCVRRSRPRRRGSGRRVPPARRAPATGPRRLGERSASTACTTAGPQLPTGGRWARGGRGRIMLSMTTASAPPLSRIILVGERSRLGSGQDAPAIRRYRLARLHVNDRPSGAGRYEHLRRSYD